jgi:hypothetical protein
MTLTLDAETKRLLALLDRIPAVAMHAIGGSNAPLFLLDFIVTGSAKRTLSLGHGLLSMIAARNMTCGRALIRMQIDTVSRLLAYTYVSDPEEVAAAVIRGAPLHTFRSKEGERLRDAYLIDRMTKTHEWVRRVYESTSGTVHFSEQQFYASVTGLREDEGSRVFDLMIGHLDTHYPESSWTEIAACFCELCEIFMGILMQYGDHKSASLSPPSPGREST